MLEPQYSSILIKAFQPDKTETEQTFRVVPYLNVLREKYSNSTIDKVAQITL